MGLADNRFRIFTNGILNQIGPSEDSERVHLESLIRADYERCHPGETFEDLRHRAQFSKEDKGLLRDWMVVAAQRAEAVRREKAAANPPVAAA